MTKCNSCSKSRGVTLKTWTSTYTRKDGTQVPVVRQLCQECYARQEAASVKA